MKTKKSVLAMRLLAIGLLFVVVPSLIKRFMPVADWAQGAIMGFGIGLELVAVGILGKLRRKRMTGS